MKGMKGAAVAVSPAAIKSFKATLVRELRAKVLQLLKQMIRCCNALPALFGSRDRALRQVYASLRQTCAFL